MTKTDTMAIAASIRAAYESQHEDATGLELRDRRAGIRVAARAVADGLKLHAKDRIAFFDFAIPAVRDDR